MTEEEISRLADIWLERCGRIFADEGGYVAIAGGGYAFEPATLRVETSTATLIELAEMGELIDESETHAYVTCTGDWQRSLYEHLNRRSAAGDHAATSALTARMTRLLADWKEQHQEIPSE